MEKKEYSLFEKSSYYENKMKNSKNKKQKAIYKGKHAQVEKKIMRNSILGHVSDLRIETKNNKHANRHLDSIVNTMAMLFPKKKRTRKVRK
ncbi:hypothetical protein KQ51_01381 [Candidatus Izimaplasma bacterium HR1]|jgi:hypothetical protein|uniref:hypothetical protein n=1 Tax=Candidatus Izimoplasma sp. HR1 TaxID=1541959 RepID=UPI0004F78836|nr:hypothetical protein KQ51_01381 [Candidatus Izimaplasma bacterium HR1]